MVGPGLMWCARARAAASLASRVDRDVELRRGTGGRCNGPEMGVSRPEEGPALDSAEEESCSAAGLYPTVEFRGGWYILLEIVRFWSWDSRADSAARILTAGWTVPVAAARGKDEPERTEDAGER